MDGLFIVVQRKLVLNESSCLAHALLYLVYLFDCSQRQSRVKKAKLSFFFSLAAGSLTKEIVNFFVSCK